MYRILTITLLILSLFSISFVNAQSSSNDIVNGLNTFGFDLYNKLDEPNQNIVFSPYSLSALLGILVTGSAGNTHTQLVHTLHLDQATNLNDLTTELDQINSTLMAQNATPSNQQPGNNETFMIGNALWADNNLSYKQTFITAIQQNHSINFYRVNFAHAADQAVAKINAWVDTQTNGYIKNLVGSVPDTTRLILTNAIYFKGSWELPFKAERTQQQPFTQENGKTIQVPMMNQKHKFIYAENDMLQMLQLNYTKSTLAMAILLPKPNHSLQQIQGTLNNNMFLQLLHSSYSPEVIVSIPKFKIESKFESLNRSMQALGLTDAFSGKANFTNMTNNPLFISQVIQKALIQVDEQGTVAAAATGIMFGTAAIVEPKPIHFIADHSFMFIIFDKSSNLIIFIGQVTLPQ